VTLHTVFEKIASTQRAGVGEVRLVIDVRSSQWHLTLKHSQFLNKIVAELPSAFTLLEQIFSFIATYKAALVCLYKLLLIAVSLIVTSSSGKRSFSKMNLEKVFFRNSRTSERLSNNDLLSVERARA